MFNKFEVCINECESTHYYKYRKLQKNVDGNCLEWKIVTGATQSKRVDMLEKSQEYKKRQGKELEAEKSQVATQRARASECARHQQTGAQQKKQHWAQAVGAAASKINCQPQSCACVIKARVDREASLRSTGFCLRSRDLIAPFVDD